MDLDAGTAGKLLENGVKAPNGKQIYNYHDGKLYEFQPDVPGSYHGYPVPGNEVPPAVLKQMKASGTITNSQYNKFIKGRQ
jgi:filamentous hemagglutinin